MQITTILAFFTAMGGLEAVKWLVRYITCRKTDARKEEASVNSMEEENRRKKVDWLEERLTQRDEKIDGLYIELRKEQEEKDLIDKYYGASGQRMRRASTRAKAVILSTEEMDDDAFIVLMEENPTYSRDPKIITRARSKTTREEVIAPVIQEESIPVTEKKETPENNGPVIRFR